MCLFTDLRHLIAIISIKCARRRPGIRRRTSITRICDDYLLHSDFLHTWEQSESGPANHHNDRDDVGSCVAIKNRIECRFLFSCFFFVFSFSFRRHFVLCLQFDVFECANDENNIKTLKMDWIRIDCSMFACSFASLPFDFLKCGRTVRSTLCVNSFDRAPIEEWCSTGNSSLLRRQKLWFCLKNAIQNNGMDEMCGESVIH